MAYYGSAQFAQEMAKKAQASHSGSLNFFQRVAEIADVNRTAAWKANQESAKAQAQQYEYNLQMMREANALQASMFNQSMAFNAHQNDLAWERSQQNWNQTANYNAQQNAIAQQYNTVEAEKQRKWQEYMSNTSYQRAMEDMRKAGLNPMLAYMQGGASTPVGSSGSISGASMSNLSAHAGSVGSGSAHAGSVGSYSGAIENTSNILASIGAIADFIEYITSKDGKNDIGKVVSDARDAFEKFDQLVDEYVKDEFPKFKGKKIPFTIKDARPRKYFN